MMVVSRVKSYPTKRNKKVGIGVEVRSVYSDLFFVQEFFSPDHM